MTDIEIVALKVLTLNDMGSLLKFQRHNPMPEPRDLLVLHPNYPDGKKHRDHKEYPVFVGLHATLGGVDYICKLAHLSDDLILAATESGYTEDQIHKWLLAGHDIFPYLKDGQMAEAGTQLEIAVKQGIGRVI